ncbi:MAG: helix-turn-helix domain-containing protein [Streptosporangiaceae bacterium]
MTNQTYGQHCGLARALEMVGEPWAMLVIRDLLVESKTMAQLRQGLPGMPEDVLPARLEELERAQVIRRREPLALADTSVFELTAYGVELEDIVTQLCRWGMRTMGGLQYDEIITADSLIMGLRVTFSPEAARGIRVNFVVELGNVVVHACINNGEVEIGRGHLLDADLIIEAGPPLQLLLSGEMSPREALEAGGVRLRAPDGGPGNFGLLVWFVELFHIPPPPVHSNAGGLMQSMRRSSAPPALIGQAAKAGTIRAGSIR